MKFSIVLLFQALLAGATSLFTLFILKSALRRVLRGNEREHAGSVAKVREPVESTVTAREYSPHARVLSILQGAFPALVFLFPLAMVALAPGKSHLTSVVLFVSILFLGLGIVLAERAGALSEENPYAPKGRGRDASS